NGSSAIVAQKEIPEISIPILIVKDTKYEIARIANILNDFPSSKLNLIGVTGTNGKTTVTHLIERIYEYNSEQCALIGTLGQKLKSDDKYTDAKHTTPQAPELQKTLKKMLDAGIKNAAIEVSSHALDQHRVGGCEFKGAVLTNLTQDHLDYHITMQNYFEAKSKLFKELKAGTYAVINLDDERAEDFLAVVPKDVKTITYGIKNQADIMAKNLAFTVDGAIFDAQTPSGEFKVKLKMTGLFSVYNALAAFATGIAEKIDPLTCIKALEETQGVAGRFEVVTTKPLSIVDYAHTPDGLENVLKASKEVVPTDGQLICVFGCGGDRDATKRPKMATIVENLADKIIITSDNPRTEDPQQIITDIISGIHSYDSDRIFVEIDRRAAIELAMKMAKPQDLILIAGKGHEDYQILKDKTIHFDDKEEVLKAWKIWKI
ncbi:MAG: UDP-N-acetylmuramoyl-L-alanyl-D-glutamate--2,6-diaminopimelate ligase, partial [Candidatus Gastranaerophilaceae bacterium]